MTQDRSHSGHFRVTKDFLLLMLRECRVGFTAAKLILQELRLIAYPRGDMRVLRRIGGGCLQVLCK